MTTLYRKYRPTVWSEVVGQSHVTLTLGQEIFSGSIAHAYLFSGPRGVGKTTAARIFARGVNCSGEKGVKKNGEPCGECQSCVSILDGRAMDIIEIDAASHRGIEMVRETIIEGSRFAPSALRYKVFIIDEVHMLSNDAWNALLKTLEEPPAHAIFILATTELHKVPATVVSRCERFSFRRISDEVIAERLRSVASKESKKVEDKVIDAIVRLADGGMRDAESLLGQLISASGKGDVGFDVAESVLPVVGSAHAEAVVDALLTGNQKNGFDAVAAAKLDGVDALRLIDEVMMLLREKMLVGEGVGECVKLIAKLVEARQSAKFLIQPFLAVEMVVGGLLLSPSVSHQDGKASLTRTDAKTEDNQIITPQKPSSQSFVEVVKEVVVKEDVAAPTPQSLAQGIVSVTEVAKKWPDFLAKAGAIQASLSFLLAGARPVGVEGATVKLGFTFAFHKDKCNEDKNRLTLEKVLSEIFGANLVVEGVLLEKTDEVGHTVSTEGVEPVLAGAAVGSVNALADAFGGKVV